MQTTFDELKEVLTSVPCLALSDPDGEFEVTTDTSEGNRSGINSEQPSCGVRINEAEFASTQFVRYCADLTKVRGVSRLWSSLPGKTTWFSTGTRGVYILLGVLASPFVVANSKCHCHFQPSMSHRRHIISLCRYITHDYSIHDKEMCAIMHALERWWSFLLEQYFKIYTNHRSLVHFKTQSNLNQRQLRWPEKAADHDMEILYKPGKENLVAHELSRIRINLLCPLPTCSLRTQIVKGYRNSPPGKLIKVVEKREEPTKWYTVEKAYNNTVQSATDQTPFYLNYGHHPAGITRHEPVDNPHAEDKIRYLLRLQEAARDAINNTQQVQRRNADERRTDATLIKEGNWILLKRKEREKRKLAPIANRPFRVTKIGTNAVTLRFPRSLVHILRSTFPEFSYTLDLDRNP